MIVLLALVEDCSVAAAGVWTSNKTVQKQINERIDWRHIRLFPCCRCFTGNESPVFYFMVPVNNWLDRLLLHVPLPSRVFVVLS